MTRTRFSRDERAQLVRELERRQKIKGFTPVEILTRPQREFANDKNKFKMALCGRGAGKTTATATVLLDAARRIKGANCGYVTGTRRMAKNIMWPILIKMNIEYALGFVPNYSDLTMVHSVSGGRIQLSGANNVVEVDKLRGQPWDMVNIDEGQSLGRTLKGLIEDVIEPRLVDRNGSILLTGTPGPVPAGPFYEAWEQGRANEGWSLHEWTMADNPHILQDRTFESVISGVAERRGIEVNDPAIQREYFGKWIQDTDALVIRLTEANYFDDAPKCDEHVMGMDLGFDDADAIAVMGWPWVSTQKTTYLTEEHVYRGESALDALDRAMPIYERINPCSFSIDTAGLGKKIAASFIERGLPVTPFDKSEKTARAMILRSAALRGELKVRKGGPFDEDCKLLCWEYDAAGRKRISDKGANDRAFHSDIFDAVLGAYLESMAHRSTAPKPAVPLVEQMRADRKAHRKRQAEPDALFAGDAADDMFDAGESSLWPT